MTEVAVHLKQVETVQVSSEWDRIEYLLNCAQEYWEEHYTLEQLRSLLMAGFMQFWHLRREGEDTPYLGALTQIDAYGKKKVLRIIWLGGESFDETMNFLWILELWAAKMGCADLVVEGRDAFERLLRAHGFHKTHVVLCKKLKHVSTKEH